MLLLDNSKNNLIFIAHLTTDNTPVILNYIYYVTPYTLYSVTQVVTKR